MNGSLERASVVQFTGKKTGFALRIGSDSPIRASEAFCVCLHPIEPIKLSMDSSSKVLLLLEETSMLSEWRDDMTSIGQPRGTVPQ